MDTFRHRFNLLNKKSIRRTFLLIKTERHLFIFFNNLPSYYIQHIVIKTDYENYETDAK